MSEACLIPTGAQLGQCRCADCSALVDGFIALQQHLGEETERLIAKHPAAALVREQAMREGAALLGLPPRPALDDDEIAFPAKPMPGPT